MRVILDWERRRMKSLKRINFEREYGILIFLGLKKSTIRLEKKVNEGDTILLTLNNKEFAVAKVTAVVLLKVSEINDAIAFEDGFLSVDALKNALKKFYPNITEETIVYQVKFSLRKILNLSLIERDVTHLCSVALGEEPLSFFERTLLQKTLSRSTEKISYEDWEKIGNILKRVYVKLTNV